MDYEKFIKNAKAHGERMGLGTEAEDFAQEAAIGIFEDGTATVESLFKEYQRKHRAVKSIFGTSQGQFSAYRTVSLDAPIDHEDADSAKFGDLIGSFRDELECRREVEFYGDIAWRIIGLSRNAQARHWAQAIFEEYLGVT